MTKATLNVGEMSTSAQLRIAGRDIVKDLPVMSIDVEVRPMKSTLIRFEIAATAVNVLGVPVLQVRRPDGTLVTGRLVLDDGTSYP